MTNQRLLLSEAKPLTIEPKTTAPHTHTDGHRLALEQRIQPVFKSIWTGWKPGVPCFRYDSQLATSPARLSLCLEKKFQKGRVEGNVYMKTLVGSPRAAALEFLCNLTCKCSQQFSTQKGVNKITDSLWQNQREKRTIHLSQLKVYHSAAVLIQSYLFHNSFLIKLEKGHQGQTCTETHVGFTLHSWNTFPESAALAPTPVCNFPAVLTAFAFN